MSLQESDGEKSDQDLVVDVANEVSAFLGFGGWDLEMLTLGSELWDGRDWESWGFCLKRVNCRRIEGLKRKVM